MNENPLTHTSLKQDGTTGRRKTWMTVTAIVLAVIAVAGIAYSVYAWQQNQKLSSDVTSKNNQIASLQKQVSNAKTTPTTTSTTQPTDPYAGWQSATLKYEKLSFKYPSTWKLENVSTVNGRTGNITPGSDQAKLTSPSGLAVTIDTGVSGIGDGPYTGKILSVLPIATLGSSYFLGFGTGGDPTSSVAYSGVIGTTSDTRAAWPMTKNVSSTGDKAFDVVSMGYFDAAGNAVSKPVSAFQADGNYNDALLIIKSLSY